MSGATASRVRAVETHAEIGRKKIRELMWRDVGLVRTGDGLQDAVHGLTRVARRLRSGLSETHNLLTVAGLVTQAAFVRQESREAHFRSDDVPTPGSRDENSVGNG